MKATWLDRALFVSPYYFTLCTTEKLFKRELKKLNLPPKVWPNFLATKCADAAIHYFEKSSGALCAIVCMKVCKGKSTAQLHAMLVHESVHLWQAVRETLGEKSPSSELEAYAIQSLSQRLIEELKRQTK